MEIVSTMLVVLDLEESRQFYINILGLKIKSEHSNRICFSVGNHEIVMFQGEGRAIKSKHASDANSTLIFYTNNLDKKITKFKSNGVEFVHETPINKDWGRYAAFKDPSGIVHEIFEPST